MIILTDYPSAEGQRDAQRFVRKIGRNEYQVISQCREIANSRPVPEKKLYYYEMLFKEMHDTDENTCSLYVRPVHMPVRKHEFRIFPIGDFSSGRRLTMKLSVFMFAIIVFFTLSGQLITNHNHASVKNEDIDKYHAEMAASWNETVMAIAVAEDGLLTLKGLRTLSMLHTAMHDALNAIIPVFDYYAFSSKAQHANPIAAAARAEDSSYREIFPVDEF